jgi:hypothetical protein
MAFDPCREWLGIDPADLADPRRVLGLDAGGHEPAVIERAAERQVSRLEAAATGPFEQSRAGLIRRIEWARAMLIERAPPAGPGALGKTAPPPAAEPPSDAFVFSEAASPRPRRRRRSSGAGVLLVVAASLTAAAAGLVAFRLNQQGAATGRQLADRADLPGQNQAPLAEPAESALPAGSGRPAALAGDANRKDSAAEPAPPPAATSVEDRPGPEPAMAADGDVDAGRQAAIDSLLADALAALQREDFDAADRAVAGAAERAGDDVKAATRVEAWRLLANYAREFAGYREQAFAAAAAGREYSVADRVVAIVEVTPTTIVYKDRGRVMSAPRDRLEPRLARAIVEAWFAADGRAANHLFLGAHWFCLDPPNLRRAQAEWRTAGEGGEVVAPLLALCDDPVVRRPPGR